MFVDKVEVHVKAGDGGNGIVSFRHEKFVDKGGPDGGDGGRGGNVVFMADENVNTLLKFRYKQEIKAEDGQAGSKRQKHGRNGKDVIIKVPVGTVIMRDGQLLADLVVPDRQVVVARGGQGGFGNAHFKSSTRQTPRVAELGEKGEEFPATLELKLLADVGLVGFPNAGKSTFLSVVSNAHPEIGDYPFTTLRPNLGVADVDDLSILIADIPGLIEGASEGKGLGDAFLRHVERTAVLLHLIDIYESDVAGAYQTIMHELAAHSRELATRPQVVALTKIEGLDDELVEQQIKALRTVVPADIPVVAISALARLEITPLLRLLKDYVQQSRKAKTEEAAEAENQPSGVVPTIELSTTQKEQAWRVRHDGGRFVVTGTKIEKFAARTNFASEHGTRRLWDIMHKMGILHELERQGIAKGDVVAIGSANDYTLVY